jgi:hypothetical protein
VPVGPHYFGFVLGAEVLDREASLVPMNESISGERLGSRNDWKIDEGSGALDRVAERNPSWMYSVYFL